jgi:hypothetical protein
MLAVLVVSGCATGDTATRNAPTAGVAGVTNVQSLTYDVQEVRVSVPETLSVSEANLYFPRGDIVWRGDPQGDRYAQVKAIVEAGLQSGVAQMQPGVVPVVLDVEVTKFHALTEKARYTVGGVHAVQFNVVLRNPETGAAYNAPHLVKADFKAFGGKQALEAEAQGLTQKKRITEHLAQVIQVELTSQGGYRATNLGLIGALNQL